MDRQRSVSLVLIGVAGFVLFGGLILSLATTTITLAQISIIPTPTRTPWPTWTPTLIAPTPTNTPVPPTATNTPISPTATNTPLPPTPTPFDTEPPVSEVLPLRPVRIRRFFRVRWQGEDSGGSGIQCYDVQVRDGVGLWQDWQTCTTDTVAVFAGERGHTYRFRSRATDNAGNVEAWPARFDTWTRILGR
ncbi:MAG: hypothetical protein ACK2UQ_17240 [Anaerolineae bacterium]